MRQKYNYRNINGIVILSVFALFLMNVLVEGVINSDYSITIPTMITGAGLFILGLISYKTFSHYRKTSLYNTFFLLIAILYAVLEITIQVASIFAISLLAIATLGLLFLLVEEKVQRQTKRRPVSSPKRTTRKAPVRRKSTRRKTTRRRR